MKNTGCCPKCNSRNIVRAPDNPNRHASGNNIYTTTMTLFGKIPVNWMKSKRHLDKEVSHGLGH